MFFSFFYYFLFIYLFFKIPVKEKELEMASQTRDSWDLSLPRSATKERQVPNEAARRT